MRLKMVYKSFHKFMRHKCVWSRGHWVLKSVTNIRTKQIWSIKGVLCIKLCSVIFGVGVPFSISTGAQLCFMKGHCLASGQTHKPCRAEGVVADQLVAFYFIPFLKHWQILKVQTLGRCRLPEIHSDEIQKNILEVNRPQQSQSESILWGMLNMDKTTSSLMFSFDIPFNQDCLM